MYAQVNELLDSKLVKKNLVVLKLEDIDLVGALLETIDMMKNQATYLKVDLQYLGPQKGVYVQVDLLRVQQILINLLSNAIKFSPAGSTVYVKLWVSNKLHQI